MSDPNLFEAAGLQESAPRPLADRLRPEFLSEVVGQEHLTGDDGTLTRMLKSGRIGSLILWGPPGTGKTTVARLLADETDLEFHRISAISRRCLKLLVAGVKPGRELCFLSTRFIASTAPSRTASCLSWRTAQ